MFSCSISNKLVTLGLQNLITILKIKESYGPLQKFTHVRL